MMTTYLRVLIPAFLAAGMCLTPVVAAGAQDPDVKIDRGLITTLVNSDEGNAPFFIIFSEKADLRQAQRLADWNARGKAVVEKLQETADRSQNGVRGYLQGHKIAYTAFWVENTIYVRQGTLDLARELSKRNEVAAIIPETIYTVPPVNGTVGTQSVGWNLSQIGADQVWSTYAGNPGAKGGGIVVANIDTGVQYTHPAVASQYRGNQGGGVYNHAGNWYDPAAVCAGGTPCDNMGHGTHTMGTMVGDDGGSNQIGVAPQAKWIACKGCESNTCSGASLIACAQWVMAPGGNSNNRPNVVNNSWGGGHGDSWYRSYVTSWVSAGIFPAFSAGNSGPSCNTAGSPGDYPESFASGAVDSASNIAGFSSRGLSGFGFLKPELAAPGVSIYSSVPNGYAYYSGTSMASPHTAGVVALLWALQPSYKGNVAATKSLLTGNATARGTTETCGNLAVGAIPNNTYGSGLLDAKKTVDAGGGPVNQPPSVTITTPSGDGLIFNCGESVGFVASASDPENSPVTVQWSGAGSPATGSGNTIAKIFSCSTELGSRNVVASVTDQGGLTATDTVIVNIVNPNGPPSAPSGVTGSVSGSTVTVRWTDTGSNTVGFYVYRREKAGKGWTAWSKFGPVLKPGTTYVDSSVPSGNYQYYVTAYNNGGESAASSSVSVRVK